MQFIAHRINEREALTQIPTDCGVELDLRDQGGEVVVVHDPFVQGESFQDWIGGYRHQTLILNVKSERIETRVLEILRERGIRDCFFLDSSYPMIVQLGRTGERRQALRFSEFEGLENFTLLKDYCAWAWIDCFSRLPLDRRSYDHLKDLGYRLCLVSPELQGRPQDIVPYRDYLLSQGLFVDAVCSKIKNLELWRPYLEGENHPESQS